MSTSAIVCIYHNYHNHKFFACHTNTAPPVECKTAAWQYCLQKNLPGITAILVGHVVCAAKVRTALI